MRRIIIGALCCFYLAWTDASTCDAADGAKNGEKNSVSQAFELRMAGKVDEAKALLTKALAGNPKDAAAHFELARVHFYTMELDLALKEVEEAVTLRPDNARYHYLKGMTETYNMVLKGHDPKARAEMELLGKKSLKSFRRAVKLDPKNQEARLQLINLCLKMTPIDGGGRAEAEKLVKPAETLDAIGGAKARCMLLGSQAKEQQRDVWVKLVTRQPNSAGAHEGLGRAWLLLGDTDKATVHLDKALKLDPARSVILVDLARHYFFAKDYDKAEQIAKRYLDFEPEPIVPMRAYGTFMIAKIHKVQEHDERAEEFLDQARKIDPHLWQAVMHPPEILFTAPSANMFSSASADDADSDKAKLQGTAALKVLGQYVGDWTSEVTSKPAVWTPKEINYRASNHAEFVLDGRFLEHIEVNHVVGDPDKLTKSLFLWTYDPKLKKYVGWSFQSSGIMGKATGTWDAASMTFTHISSEPPPNTTSTFTEAFPKSSTINGTLVFTGDDGKTMFDMVWTRKRQAGIAGKPTREQWAEIGTPIQPIPEEVKKLGPLVGTWDSTYEFRVPQRPDAKGVITDEWSLDGRFIMRRETVGSTKSIAMIGWDDTRQAYRIARAISNGRTNEASGQWNDVTRSLVWNWKMADDSKSVRAIATWRFVGTDFIQLHVVHETEKDVLLDLTIKMSRRK